MRLNRLDLTRYGHFTDQSLTFPQPAPDAPDLHLIYGPNEAGKSTALSAWLDLLFGIPVQSRNNFLHPYPALRIGAALDLDGTEVEVVRVKKTAGSLLDGYGAALPEALLQGGLGGLTRDSYAAMFSLDDDTLVQGGDSILASKGDLGEMLFSASAGMADLGRKLEVLRAEADSFYRAGGRKGPVTEAKAQLAGLEDQRKALDVQAGAYKALLSAETEAELAWTSAKDHHEALTQALGQGQHSLRLVPLQARLQRLQAELTPFAALQPLPQGGAERLALVQKDIAAASVRREETLLALGRAERALAALTADPAVLALSGRIAATGALRAAHDEAVKDLPNRRSEADEQAEAMALALAQIGQPAADPRGLLLPAPVVAGLRRLIASRSGVASALAAADKEVVVAGQAVARLDQRLNEAGAPGDLAGDPAVLTGLLARLKQRDPAEVLLRAERALTLAADELARRMAAVSPWRGTADGLAQLQVPGSWQVEAWTAQAEALRVAVADAGRHVTKLRADLALAPVGSAEGGLALGLADAAAARSLRERLWADHRHSLSAASAAEFETSMRQDDQIAALLAEMQADARMQAAERAAVALAAQTLALAEMGQAAAVQAQRDHEAEVAGAMAALTLPGHALADLRLWLDNRTAALTARTLWLEAERDRQTSLRGVSEAGTALRLALGLADAPLDLLWVTAQSRIDADRTLLNLREQGREARAALLQRQTDLADATKADQIWQADWQALTADTWVAGQGADTAAPVLAGLDRLEKAVLLHDGLTLRIAKMNANRDSFVAECATIAADLDLHAATRWEAITGRLRSAELTEAALTREAAALTEAQQKLADLTAQDQAAQATLQQMADALATTITDLPGVVAGSLQAAALRRDIAACTSELAEAGGHGDDPAVPDRVALEARAVTLTTEADQANGRLQASYATLAEARRQVLAVGGDDAVARIEAERANVLEALAEGARAHLARRLGILVLDKALLRYRDTHRSAMLARASTAFTTLTRGAYRSLAAQPKDAGREVLVAVAQDGGTKLADELSKGTRFQLYLALRIAGYHELAKSRKPVPFLADDIMETFDNDRAAEAFRLLAEMGKTGQVIYLTHHVHLCDIARAECPGVTVHILQPRSPG